VNACAVCAVAIVDDDHGRERLYCSQACRMRAFRDRKRGRLRLLGGNDGPEYAQRPGLRHVGRGVYETRDGGIRIESDGRRWSVALIVNGVRYPTEPTYPTLRAARHAAGVEPRRIGG